MSETEIKKAIWTPSWYEMDQSVAVGTSNKFWFFQDCPNVANIGDDIDMVFFNELDSTNNSELRFADVTDIQHKALGKIIRVDTDGLDYIFTQMDGTEILVNAEEEPGKTYDDNLEIEDWTIIVFLANISDPIADADVV